MRTPGKTGNGPLLVTLAGAAALAIGGGDPAPAQTIFQDDFESGTTTAWSSTVGEGSGGSEAVVETVGAADRVLLRGWVITPDESFAGDVLISGDTLVCVDVDCSGDPDATGASVVITNGIILPGLIDAHNHAQWGAFDADDWSPMQIYTNHGQWPAEAQYQALNDARQYLAGQNASPINLTCELNKWGELKGLIAGTTSMVGFSTPAGRSCYRTLVRTIDDSGNGLCGTEPPVSCPDAIQVANLFPSRSAADSVCNNLDNGSTQAYLIHLGEGTDTSARGELDDLATVTSTDNCLLVPQTAVIHGTAFEDSELSIVAANGMKIVWSPQSDLTLYGSTLDIGLALNKGITVALGAGFSLTGSESLLMELRVAADNSALDAAALVTMVTANAAAVLALDDQIGHLAAGYKADVVVIGGDTQQPYASVLAAGPADVRMVYIDGRLHYGDDQLQSIAPSSPGCEAISICGRNKFICVAREGGTGTEAWGQTLADIEDALEQALSDYDDLNLSAWDFAPIAPLSACQ